MPTPLLKKYAKQAGKTVQEAEVCWDKAKRRGDRIYQSYQSRTSDYWAYVNAQTKRCLGIDTDKATSGSTK